MCVAQAGKIESLGAATGAGISDAVKKALEPKGYRVVLDDGSTACEIWLRQSVTAQAKKDVPGTLYPQLPVSTLIGVISFSQAATDYRGEPIKPGAYTLRYELLPNDGAHLGVTPNRDFLLLIPAASDANPDSVFASAELINLSRQATGTAHPGPLSMVQPPSGSAASVSKDEEDHWVFSGTMKLSSGEDLPFALIVKGTVPQ